MNKEKNAQYEKNKATGLSVISEQQMEKDRIQYLMNSPKREEKITCMP